MFLTERSKRFLNGDSGNKTAVLEKAVFTEFILGMNLGHVHYPDSVLPFCGTSGTIDGYFGNMQRSISQAKKILH